METESKKSLTSWFNHPFWGSYLFFFTLYNWNILYPLFFFEGNDRFIGYIEAVYYLADIRSWDIFGYPFVSSAGYVLISPWFGNFLEIYKEFRGVIEKRIVDRIKKIDYSYLLEQVKVDLDKQSEIANILKSIMTKEVNEPILRKMDGTYFILIANEHFEVGSFLSYNRKQKKYGLSDATSNYYNSINGLIIDSYDNIGYSKKAFYVLTDGSFRISALIKGLTEENGRHWGSLFPGKNGVANPIRTNHNSNPATVRNLKVESGEIKCESIIHDKIFFQ